MMKKFLLVLLVAYSLEGNSQSFKERFFSSFAFTMLADVNYGPLKEVSIIATNENNLEYKGYSRDFALGLLTYQYGMRVNLIENGSDFSMGIFVPISASISMGNTKYLLEAQKYNSFTQKYESKSISGSAESYGRISFPAFLQFSFGAGSTYSSEKEKGITLGVGVDMSLSPLFISELDDLQIKRFNLMPAMNIGRRTTSKNELIEYNLKFGYVVGKKEFVTNSSSLNTPGMVVMLSVGKILNY